MDGLQYHLVNFEYCTHKEEEMSTNKTALEKDQVEEQCIHKHNDEEELGSVDGDKEETTAVYATNDLTAQDKRRTTHSEKKKKSKKTKKMKIGKSNSLVQKILNRKQLSYSEAQKYVKIEVDGEINLLAIDECLPVISQEEYERTNPPDPNASPVPDELPIESLDLPYPAFSAIENYNISDCPKPAAYIRFIEKTPEELDAEVEYDMDEDDGAWLEIMNDNRSKNGLPEVSFDTFELIMDRLEKESYFQLQSTKGHLSPLMDEDAVCCICVDGECQNSNVILFCDMCDLVVHQDCYGVPYIPQGQWLCRKCLQSPSRAVDCVLCPNQGGAFKQTDQGYWVHVVCALWIPEVCFANTVFLEPIAGIESILPSRYKLICYLCKQRGVGACIQCNKSNCFSAFHVTCAQEAGLYMKIRASKGSHSDDGSVPVLVQKRAYCETHSPFDPDKLTSQLKQQQLQRKLKKSSAFVVNIPTISPERVQVIASLVNIPRKNQFIQRILAYWTLKRYLGNGVPLLRRLQMTQIPRRFDAITSSVASQSIEELRKQLKYWQYLRQDLERARLLCELVRKREKLKSDLLKVQSMCLEMELFPLSTFLRRLLELIRAHDTGEIFLEPVDLKEAPDYYEAVRNPMDLSTMKKKIDLYQYLSLEEFESDFYLMINNCLTYNSKDTFLYRAAIKMREQGFCLFKKAYKDSELWETKSDFMDTMLVGDDEHDNLGSQTWNNFDLELKMFNRNHNDMTRKEKFQKLKSLLESAKSVKNGNDKSKRIKLIKSIIAKLKREQNEILNSAFNCEAENIKGIDNFNTENDKTIKKMREQAHEKRNESNTPSLDLKKNVEIDVSTVEVNRCSDVLFSKKLTSQTESDPVGQVGRPVKRLSSELARLDRYKVYRHSSNIVNTDESETEEEGCCPSDSSGTSSESGTTSNSGSSIE